VEQLVVAWYAWLSGLGQGTVFWLQGWIDHLQTPVITAILFGVIGATAPCQLTTNLGALAYVSGHPGDGRLLGLAAAYVAGKVTVYTLVGGLVIVAGLRLDAMSIPVVVAARMALGPLMLVVGLTMLGAFSLKAGFGQWLALRLRERLRGGDAGRAYLLGVAFSFAFCPTLFWLFFGLTLPLALRSTGGWAFPSLFAVGASLPLLVVTGVVAGGLGTMSQATGGLRRAQPILRRIAGVLLVLAGLHDTLIYWLL
jgi:cytochrome c biogenesis protein CcdA